MWLSENPKAIHLLENNFNKIYWNRISENPNAIHILKANLNKINWNFLSFNPNAIQILEDNPKKIDWEYLSSNPNAIHILKANPDKISWNYLSMNSNVKTIDLINNNFDKITNKKYLLKHNPNVLSIILKWDYQAIKISFYTSYGKELIEWIYNPIHYEKWGKTCWDLE